MQTQMGFEPEEDVDYRDQLNAAIRKRLLAEIEQGRGGSGQSVVNNVYGGGAPAAGGGGIREMMGSPEDRDYFVDIEREDLPDINPATGKPKGWKKKVHRFSTGRGEDPEKKNLAGIQSFDE